ncbi:MAG: hypothetical protein PH343_06625, partial [Nitrospira sp.]|nr:hypothetical protein [Nitrospira sp.]
MTFSRIYLEDGEIKFRDTVQTEPITLSDLMGVTLTGDQTIGGKKTLDEGIIINVPQTYTPDAAGTVTLDLSKGNRHNIQMPAGN